ncbi:MAG: SgcJ/EcaC family oxidoreductase [Brachymonas sp.]|nr:SgcJ/EcaC family oxidoreductase [Brachymonas sp.]
MAATPAPTTWGDDLPFSKKTTEAEIAALFDRWNTALQTGDPKNIAELYEQDAVLLPTVSNKLCLTHADIEDYFLHFMEKKPIGKIDQRYVHIEHNQAIDSGLYTFTFGETGEQLRARYTYTYRWNGKEWKISSHHSSAMPIKQPPDPS